MYTCIYSVLRLALYGYMYIHKRGFISARWGISRVYQSREEQEGWFVEDALTPTACLPLMKPCVHVHVHVYA